jgi:dienelactone hydrolase
MAAIARPDEKPRDLDTHHLFTAPASRKAWEARKKVLRQQILFSAGLWPMPMKTELHPRVTGHIDGQDYTIDNVAIETLPGFYLCGNLYKPKGKHGPAPGIVNPHGHWEHGRLEMQPDVPTAAAPPANPAPGRGNLVSIGVNLARQGFVVFAYDAVGYNDTRQVDHKFANGLRPWLWSVSEMGLQLWNSIRVVDYLQSLPDVDKNRIGATGASGGGSQTFLLTAVDDRIKAAVPVNMVSAYMQGGCLCENGPGLRVGTDNVEVAAMFAPKPLLVVAATGDWTKEVPREEWPAIKRVYDLYGAGDKTAVQQFNYQHNYNVDSRNAMYAWFGKWLLNDPDASHFREQPFTADVEAMHVWNDKNPLPANALNEEALTSALIERSRRQLRELWPKTAADLPRFQEAMRPALECALGARPASMKVGGSDRAPIALIVSEDGDRAEAERVAAALKSAGRAAEILSVTATSESPDKMWANYFSCYNAPPAGVEAQRIVDRLGALAAAGHGRVDVVGVGRAGRVALLARAIAPVNGSVAADTHQIDSSDDSVWLSELYAPGMRRAGDLQTAAMLVAPSRLLLYNTGDRFAADPIRAGFGAVGATVRADSAAASPEQIARWLTGK